MYNTDNFSEQPDRARQCEEALWKYLLDLAETRKRKFAASNDIPSEMAEDFAMGSVSTTMEFLGKKDKPRTWETEEERIALMPYIDRVYHTISKRVMIKAVVRGRKHDGGSLDAQTESGITRGDSLVDPRTVRRDMLDADEQGGIFGRAVRQLLNERYSPDQADRLWKRFALDYDWSELASESGKSVEAERRWGSRQAHIIREALKERGFPDEYGGTAPQYRKHNSKDASGVVLRGLGSEPSSLSDVLSNSMVSDTFRSQPERPRT